MRIKRTELRGTFEAKDSVGEAHLLHTFIVIVGAPQSTDDPNAEIEGFYTYQMEDGREVRRHRKGEYKIWGSGEILTSDAPNAP